jgi:hypothetical protein
MRRSLRTWPIILADVRPHICYAAPTPEIQRLLFDNPYCKLPIAVANKTHAILHRWGLAHLRSPRSKVCLSPSLPRHYSRLLSKRMGPPGGSAILAGDWLILRSLRSKMCLPPSVPRCRASRRTTPPGPGIARSRVGCVLARTGRSRLDKDKWCVQVRTLRLLELRIRCHVNSGGRRDAGLSSEPLRQALE